MVPDPESSDSVPESDSDDESDEDVETVIHKAEEK